MNIEFEIFDILDAFRKAAGVSEKTLAKHIWPEISVDAAAVKYSRMMNPDQKKKICDVAGVKRQALSITDAIRICDLLGLSFLEVTANVMVNRQDWPKSRSSSTGVF